MVPCLPLSPLKYCMRLYSPPYMPYACPSHPPWTHKLIPTSEEYESQSSWFYRLRSFPSLLLHPLTYTQVHSSIPYAWAPSAYNLPSVWELKFHIHTKPEEKFSTLYFLNRKREDKWSWKKWWQAFPKFKLFLIYACMKLSFINVIAKYLNFVTF